jgi:hypothetical protein
MKEKLEKLDERNHSQKNSTVEVEEKALILKKTKARRNLDETISSPDRYVSWYQYNMKDIDKYLQLCPHCKKPTLSAFDRTVIDSAIDYLEGKRIYSRYATGNKDFMPTITFLVALGIGIYFLVTHVISIINT